MDPLVYKVVLTVLTSLTAGGIGLIFWQVRKGNKYKEQMVSDMKKAIKDNTDDMKTTREEFVIQRTEFNRMKEDWKEKKVDKAYDSARRGHERMDDIEKKMKKLEEGE